MSLVFLGDLPPKNIGHPHYLQRVEPGLASESHDIKLVNRS
jgi:hypothetical protein